MEKSLHGLHTHPLGQFFWEMIPVVLEEGVIGYPRLIPTWLESMCLRQVCIFHDVGFQKLAELNYGHD